MGPSSGLVELPHQTGGLVGPRFPILKLFLLLRCHPSFNSSFSVDAAATAADPRHELNSVIMTSWWTDERINTTVTREYITREIGSRSHQDALHHPLAFGDGLTDDTYLDWILEKSRRCFLILNSIGVPERIFQLVDKSLDDDDLPLSEEALFDLNLFGGKSETLDKKFYRQQFTVLVQDLVPGSHLDFGADEVVPVEQTKSGRKSSVVNGGQASDRVYVHNRLYTRKKIPTSGDNGIDRVHFVMHLKALQSLKHPHLVSVWATYTQNEYSYILLHPSTDITLRQFLDEQPKSFKTLEKQQRRETLLRWTHCIISALAYLHDSGLTHQNIRPSNVTIDSNNTIYLANFAALNALDPIDQTKTYRTEIYEHAAPENWRLKPSLYETAPDKIIHQGGGRTARRIPNANKPSRPSSRTSPTFLPGFSTTSQRARSATTSSSTSSSNSRPNKAIITTFAPQERFAPGATPADVFSLSTIILHLTSLLLGYGPKSFASHRSRHNRQAGRGGAPADASFHVNLREVGTWQEMLIKEAREREKKDKKGKGTGGTFWRSVGGVVHSSEGGLRKESSERYTAREMELKVGKYVSRTLGKQSGLPGCGCRDEDDPGNADDNVKARMKRMAEKGKAREVELPRQGIDEEEEEEQEEEIVYEPMYTLSQPVRPAMLGPFSTTSTASGRYSAIDQERRMGMVLPVMDNWPLRT